MREGNTRALAALVAAAAVVVYANALWNGFALDDAYIIQANARVHTLADQAGIWLTPYWPTYGPELGLYRPLAIFGYAVQWALGSGAPWVFHATSIALHAGVSLLVFALLRTLVTPAAAAAGALVFAAHPLHAEAVANIVGQAELLAAAALLGAVVIAATRPAGARIDWPRRIVLCALFALGALAKESVVVLPALIVAADAAQGRIGRRFGGYARELAVPVVLLAASFAAVLLLRFSVLGTITGTHVAPGLPFLHGDERVLVALRALPELLRLLFFPLDLSADYAPAVILPVTSVTPLVALGGVLLVGTAALAALTPVRPAAGLAAAWFAITILPISNLFFPIGVVVAERLLYAPSVGVAILVAYLWRHAADRNVAPQRTRALALAGLVALLGVRAVVRNADWKDTPTVIAALVRDHPESYRAQLSVGTALLATDPVRGRDVLDMAHRTWPHDPFLLSQIGRLDLGAGRIAPALALLERSRTLAPFVHETESSLAYGYIASGRPHDALAAIGRAERLGADPATLVALRAQAYEALGWNAEAAGAWRVAARNGGADAPYWARFARSLARDGRTAAALAAVDTARDVVRPEAHATLALLAQAIGAGCYHGARPAAADACADPLAHQRMLLPGQREANGRNGR